MPSNMATIQMLKNFGEDFFSGYRVFFLKGLPRILYQTKCDRNQLSKPRITAWHKGKSWLQLAWSYHQPSSFLQINQVHLTSRDQLNQDGQLDLTTNVITVHLAFFADKPCFFDFRSSLAKMGSLTSPLLLLLIILILGSRPCRAVTGYTFLDNHSQNRWDIFTGSLLWFYAFLGCFVGYTRRINSTDWSHFHESSQYD